MFGLFWSSVCFQNNEPPSGEGYFHENMESSKSHTGMACNTRLLLADIGYWSTEREKPTGVVNWRSELESQHWGAPGKH